MNSTRPTPLAGPATPGPFHSSTRTALSQNVDPASGQRTRVLTTSKLELAWQAGELVVRCAVARAVICGHEETARARRRAPGAR